MNDMAVVEDDFIDDFVAEFDVLKVRLTYLVTSSQNHLRANIL